jgi:hypothetical protein
LAAEAGAGLLSAVSSYARGDKGGAMKAAFGLLKSASGSGNQAKADAYAKKTRTSPADVVRLMTIYMYYEAADVLCRSRSADAKTRRRAPTPSKLVKPQAR